MNASLTTILLATDGSSDAALAGRAAADISRKTGAQLHVVHVGSRGLGAPKRMILGSVSTRVLREAEGPVLIAPRVSHSITVTRRPTSAEPRRGGSETEPAKRVSPHRSR